MSRNSASGTWIRIPAPSPESWLAAGGTAVLEVAQGGQRVLHDLVTGLTGHGRDECDTAGVVLERWSYRPLAGIMGTPGLGSTDRTHAIARPAGRRWPEASSA